MIGRFLLSPWIFYFLSICGLVFAIILVIKGKQKLITASVLADRRDDVGFVYDLLCAELPGACILKDAPVGSAGTGSVQISQTIDILYISKGGEIVISVVNGNGAYDNPKTGSWRHRYLGNNGKTVTVTLPNPFDSTVPAANLLEGLLIGEKIYVDVKRIAVFTGSKIGMTMRYPEAMSVDSLLTYLRNFNQNSTMNGPQFRTASEVITAFAQYNQHRILTSKYGNYSLDQDLTEQTSNDFEIITESTPHPSQTAKFHTAEAVASDNEEAVRLLREIQSKIDEDTNIEI